MPTPLSDDFKKFLLKESVENASKSVRNAQEAFERFGKAFSNDNFRKLFGTDITGVSTSAIDRKSGITGMSADMVIVDDPLMEAPGFTITKQGDLRMARLDQNIALNLDVEKLPESERILKFQGGQVTVRMKDDTYRKRAVPPTDVTLRSVYVGKRDGEIMVFEAKTTRDLIEIPVKNAYDYFGIPDFDGLLKRIDLSKIEPNRNLYNKELVQGLPDFGAF